MTVQVKSGDIQSFHSGLPQAKHQRNRQPRVFPIIPIIGFVK
jgi:hypothetical protein